MRVAGEGMRDHRRGGARQANGQSGEQAVHGIGEQTNPCSYA